MKEKLTPVGVVLALVIGVFALMNGGQDGMPGMPGTPGTPGIGAVSGPDSYLPYMANNDVKVYSFSQKINSASSTAACQFRSPAATTTIAVDGLVVNADSATGTTQWFANQFPNGEITPSGTYSTSTGSFGLANTDAGRFISPVYVGSSTPSNMSAQNGGRVLAPNTVINVGFAGFVNTQNPGWGTCQLQLKGTI